MASTYNQRLQDIIDTQAQIDRIMNALEDTPVGVTEVRLGETTVKYDRKMLLKELEHFQSKLARLKRGNRFSSINLSNGLGGND